MGKKKKFIEKKKSATFQLLARDYSDPNYHEGPSGDRVFVRVDNNPFSADSFFDEPNVEDDPNSIFADAPDDSGDDDDAGDQFPGKQARTPAAGGSGALPDHVRREILELGFPDDGYNYLTHLREIKNSGAGSAYYQNSKAKLDQVPADVKAYDASRVEIPKVTVEPSEKLINSVASKIVGVRIQKAVDPEVAALLDDSDLSRFGSDVEDMEEDFVVQANLPEEGEDVGFENKLSLTDEYELNVKQRDDQDNLLEFVGGNKARNHPTNVNKDDANENPRVRRLLDEQFDMLELQEYGTESEDDYNGSIDEEDEEVHESLAGKLNHAFKDRALDNLGDDDKYRAPSDLLHETEQSKDKESLESAAHLIRRCMEYAENYENDNQDEEVIIVEESSDESEKWDCETIITTYSNLDNHPGKIGAPDKRRKKKLAETLSAALNGTSQVISLKGKEKLPVDFLPSSRKSVTEKVKNVGGLKTEPQKRKQQGQESKEEKKERKAAVKEERREARRLKKETKDLYKSEAQRAQRVAAIAAPSSIHLM